MAVSLLSYQGNANLGSGSNPQIPVLPNQNLDFINQTIRDISARDYDTNIKLYNQKIADRNQLTQMVLAGQVPPGDIDPKYRKEYDTARKKLEEVYTKYGGDIVNNPQGFREYANARNDLRDTVAHAQTNTVELQKVKQEAAKEALPWKRKRLEDHYKKQYDKPFWDVIDPYQQVYDMDIDKIIGQPKKFSRTVNDPTNPLNQIQEEYLSYNDILKTQVKDFAEAGENWHNQNLWLEKLQSYDPAKQLLTIDAMNNQLKKYNEERGLQPGMQDYVGDIKIVTGPDGKQYIQESVPELAAKTALASQSQFATKTGKFNKDLAKYGLDKEKIDLQRRKLGIEGQKANAYIRNLNARTDKFVRDKQQEGINVAHQYDFIVDNIAPTSATTMLGAPGQKEDAIFIDQIPESYRFVSGPIVDKNGKITVGKLDGFKDAEGREYWKPKYVLASNGEEINPTSLSETVKSKYQQAKQRAQILRPGVDFTIHDYLKGLLKGGGVELIMRGKNGVANYTTIYNSAKALNAAGTAKGEDNIINAPSSIPQDEEE